MSAVEMDVRAAFGEFERLAPRPNTLAATGLDEAVVGELLLKHLFDAGVTVLAGLAERLALAGTILEPLLQQFRRDALVEVRAAAASGAVRYGLTEQGRRAARDALYRDGYIGPAPVPLELYTSVVRAQSAVHQVIGETQIREVFADTVLAEDILQRLGPALHSGRAIFVYGPAGSGKSFITRRLGKLLERPVLVPYAVHASGVTACVFDPQTHHPLDAGGALAPRLREGYDRRFALCRSPLVAVGGELTLDALDLHYDASRRQYQAPLQMRANNGMLILDDLGRQRVPPEAIFNRWIVPMEERRDYLHTLQGAHFSVPFDVVLLFSTNMAPRDLADDAFLRRIGYKIPFRTLQPAEYGAIWRQVCEKQAVRFDPAVVEYAVSRHGGEGVPLLACHPRDLIGLALDRCRYQNIPEQVTHETFDWAWSNYFVPLD